MRLGDSPIYRRADVVRETPVPVDSPTDPAQADDPVHGLPTDVRGVLPDYRAQRGAMRDAFPIAWTHWPWIIGMLLWWPLGIIGAVLLIRSWRIGYRGILAGMIGIAVVAGFILVNAHLLSPPLF